MLLDKLIKYSIKIFLGNILTSFSQGLSSNVIKIGFVMSIAVSFPLVIFPCRSSIYSLLATKVSEKLTEVLMMYTLKLLIFINLNNFFKDYVLVSGGRQHIAEIPFKCITFFIVFFSLVTGLLMPNIEVVLGLIGSTIGVMINVMFPSMFLVKVAYKSHKERFLARVSLSTLITINIYGCK